MKKYYLLSFFALLVTSYLSAQNKEDIQKITANYDIAKLKEKENFYRRKSELDKKKAIATAQEKGWPIRIEKPDGSISELMSLTPEGLPIYYATDNVNAAKSTRTNHLHTGGTLGLNLNGQGMTVRVWDGGNVYTGHNAFGGRVTPVDATGSSTILHGTHVTGTMIATANPASVKGMAPQATARTFDWNSDLAEAISEVQLGMLVSNHSYGTPITNSGTTLPSWYIGSYTYNAYEWDDAAYEAPYYLAVMSAGNDGNNNDNPDPMGFGYDKLVGNKTAKNNLVVANCQDVTVAADGTVSAPILINSSSSQGPTDDLRVKPDITGNGTALTSTSNAGANATAVLTGTSMASPNVAGTLILLQQHYKNLTNSFMRAATLKGLACHTTDDAGQIGPDPVFGWGLLNAKKAAETLTNNGLTSWVSEENLTNGQTYTMTVNSNGTTPLMASISWTDLPGAINTGGLAPNDPMPALVNDLDIRITRNATTYYPWKLTSDPSSPAIRTEDNSVDNVEQVKIDAPTAGEYTITITHKGTLVTGAQKYSLIITGITSSFALNSNSSDLTVCSDQNAVYTFNYTQSGGVNTTFSAEGLPTGATASFSPSSLNTNGQVTMTVSGLSNVAPGEYFVGIKGTSSTETETRFKSLRIFNGTFQPVVLQSPTNGQNGLSTTAFLSWQSQANAQTYNVQVSEFNDFTSPVVNDIVTGTDITVGGLNEATRYYWRVIPQNNCGTAVVNNAMVYSFVTGNLICDLNFAAEDFSNAAIADVPNSEAWVPLTITGGYTIGDINVNIDITHTWIQDMTITLEGPASIGSPVVTLLQEACGDNQDISCTMDDAGGAPACSGVPAISGSIAPVSPLSVLNNLPADGEWILRVVDPYNQDGGSINAFSIDLCRVEAAPLSVAVNPILNSTVYPNPTKGTVNITIPSLTDSAVIYLYDLQGRLVLTKETNEVHTSFSMDNLQDGVYLVNIENQQGAITKKIILRRN